MYFRYERLFNDPMGNNLIEAGFLIKWPHLAAGYEVTQGSTLCGVGVCAYTAMRVRKMSPTIRRPAAF